MSSILFKAGRKVLERNLNTYQPEDPMYETYIDKKGVRRQKKREIPPGLSKRDAKILKSINRRAHYLDKGFSVCGFRFGWTALIGLIPFAGDIADATLNYTLVVRKARQAEIPEWLIRRMLLNNAIACGIGLVPLVGDIAMATFKCNSQNALLLTEFLRIRGEEFLKEQRREAEAAAAGGSSVLHAGETSAVTVKPSKSWWKRDGKGKARDEAGVDTGYDTGTEGGERKKKRDELEAEAEQYETVKPGAGLEKGEHVPMYIDA